MILDYLQQLTGQKMNNEVTDLYGTETINLSPGASVSSRAIVGYSLGSYMELVQKQILMEVLI